MFCAFVAPSKVRMLTVTSADPTSLTVTWYAPSEPNGNVRKYRVSYQVLFSCTLCFSEHTFKLRFYCIFQFFLHYETPKFFQMQFKTNERFVFDVAATLLITFSTWCLFCFRWKEVFKIIIKITIGTWKEMSCT